MDKKLELVVVPVSDVDREGALRAGGVPGRRRPPGRPRVPGRAADPAGIRVLDQHRDRPHAGAPRCVQGLPLVDEDIAEARAELVDAGVEVGEPFHFGPEGRADGIDPERRDHGTFAELADPDGNGWLLQEVRERVPGR